MMQSLHIFRKDARYLWKEILISLLITAGCVIFYPYTWKSHPQVADAADAALKRMSNLGTVLLILTPVSWLVLVTRCVQAEPLVGKRHFWLTRPYRWPQLLLAKVIFVCVFVLSPFFFEPVVVADRRRICSAGLLTRHGTESAADCHDDGFADDGDCRDDIELWLDDAMAGWHSCLYRAGCAGEPVVGDSEYYRAV